MMLRFHAQTAGSSLTAQQPENNLVRVAMQCLAAVLGGMPVLHANGLDEALALPTENAALLALRTQQIIAHETGVAKPSIPSPAPTPSKSSPTKSKPPRRSLHRPNRRDGRHAQSHRARLRAAGSPKSRLRISSAPSKPATQVVVGVNKFTPKKKRPFPPMRIDPRNRTHARSHACRPCAPAAMLPKPRPPLAEIERRARTGENLMPAILAAVEAYVTVGEISDALRRVFGEYRESVVV